MSPNDTDCVANIESAVLLALSKLSKNWKTSKKVRKFNGVACKNIVEFLKANYSWIDGDVESQVMTALLSCIKAGLVCALVSGRYRLIGPNAKSMATNCILRPSHGPKCSCLNMLKCFSKSYGQICCFLEQKEAAVKRKRLCTRKKALIKALSPPPKKGNAGCKVKLNCAQSTKNFSCPQKTDKQINKANYCWEIRSVPSKSLCMTCFPSGCTDGAPSNSFSPRDEPPHEKRPPVKRSKRLLSKLAST